MRKLYYVLTAVVVVASVVLLVNMLADEPGGNPATVSTADPGANAGEDDRSCVFWHDGHSHDGTLVDGECVLAVDVHDTGVDHDGPAALGFTVDPAELRPEARGEPPPSFAAFHEHTGERVDVLMPPSTPAVLEWSDWCFFGPEGGSPAGGSYSCSLEMTHFASALTYLGADEACVLEQHRLRIEADHRPGTLPGDALNEHGWHRCPSVIDPDPQPGGDWATSCESLAERDPLVAEFVATWWGGCAAWADEQRKRLEQLPEWLQAPDCARTTDLMYLWVEARFDEESDLGVSQC